MLIVVGSLFLYTLLLCSLVFGMQSEKGALDPLATFRRGGYLAGKSYGIIFYLPSNKYHPLGNRSADLRTLRNFRRTHNVNTAFRFEVHAYGQSEQLGNHVVVGL